MSDREESTISWIFKTLIIPLSFPMLMYRLYQYIKIKQFREKLPGKVVLITGCSGGLGEALAHTFYIAGCKVILAARRTEELKRVKKDLLELHSTITTHPPVILELDLSDLNSLPDKVKQILEIHPKIDILINNAGISVRSPAMSTTIDTDIKIMLVNYFGTIALTKAVLPSMIKQKEGHIVCIGSIQGKISLPSRSSYSASKYALQSFCDSIRPEIAMYGIKMTLISPGYINTSLSLNALTGDGQKYGQTDPTTSSGASPESMSKNILNAVLSGKKDVILAPFSIKIAYYLRFFCPSLFFWIVAKRAQKLGHLKKNV